jgi:hypothetical protein
LLFRQGQNMLPTGRFATLFRFRSNGEDLADPAGPLPRPKNDELPLLKSNSQAPPLFTPLLQIGFP